MVLRCRGRIRRPRRSTTTSTTPKTDIRTTTTKTAPKRKTRAAQTKAVPILAKHAKVGPARTWSGTGTTPIGTLTLKRDSVVRWTTGNGARLTLTDNARS
jgi:hypothetical protein